MPRPSDRQLALGVAGLIAIVAIELVLPAGYPRAAIAAIGWLGYSLGALLRVSQALSAARRDERLSWIFLGAGCVSWLVSTGYRSMLLIADVPSSPPSVGDAAALLGAIFFILGFIAMLRGRRLATYTVLLDQAAVGIGLVAVIAFAVQDVFLVEMRDDPVATATVLLYTILYAAATGAAISAFFAAPLDTPRRAHVWLIAGVGLTAAAYLFSLPQYLHGTFTAGTLSDPMWMLGMLAISIGASSSLEDRQQLVVSQPSPLRPFARMALPGVVGVAVGILIVVSEDHRTEAIVLRASALLTVVLAARVGLAMYSNWRQGEVEGRRARQFEALYEVGLAAAGERSFDDLLKLVVEQATALTRTDGAMLALADDPDGKFVIRALNKGPMFRLRDSVCEPLAGLSLAALESRDLVVAEQYADHPQSTPQLHDLIRSAIAIPLVAHGEVIGTLAAYSTQPRRFASETRRLIRLYTAQAAIAIANARLLAETHRLARDDDLTGVMNRRSLMERLEAEIHSANRHGDILAVALCDVDGLKSVNDSAGHLAGNEVLIKVARVMRESVRAEDIVARFGGDEFVVMLPRTGQLPAQALVSRMSTRLREETYHWAGAEHSVPRVSFGIAWFPEDGRTADALLAAADERMYVDKSRGRAAVDRAADAD